MDLFYNENLYYFLCFCTDPIFGPKCGPKCSQPIRFQDSLINHNLGQKVGDKFTKLSKISFFMECFTNDFLRFFTEKTSKFGFQVGGWVLAITCRHVRDFLEISSFPKILSVKSFGNSWGNSYIHFLMIIM